MNKQELINHIKDQNEWSGNHRFILIKKEELISMIEDLDEPQKVKVPEEFDEWFLQIKQRWGKSATDFALWKICQFGFGNGFEDVNNDRTSSTLSDWVCWNKEVAINAAWNGYEVEEEPKWIVCYSTMYLKSPLEPGRIETVEITPKKELAHPFKSYKEAKQQTSLIGGAIEKV